MGGNEVRSHPAQLSADCDSRGHPRDRSAGRSPRLRLGVDHGPRDDRARPSDSIRLDFRSHLNPGLARRYNVAHPARYLGGCGISATAGAAGQRDGHPRPAERRADDHGCRGGLVRGGVWLSGRELPPARPHAGRGNRRDAAALDPARKCLRRQTGAVRKPIIRAAAGPVGRRADLGGRQLGVCHQARSPAGRWVARQPGSAGYVQGARRAAELVGAGAGANRERAGDGPSGAD